MFITLIPCNFILWLENWSNKSLQMYSMQILNHFISSRTINDIQENCDVKYMR